MSLLDGNSALVVGVANKKSIAWGIARDLHAHGAKLGFLCLESNLRRVTKLARQVDSDIVIPVDVRDEEQIADAVQQTGERFDGRIDTLVHSVAYANITDLGGSFIKTSKSGWQLALDISAYSLLSLTRQVRPFMTVGGGSIMAMSFVAGRAVVPGYNIMGIAKAALEMTVRYLAYDLGPENIRVNAISPGPVSTPSSIMIEDFQKALELTVERSPLVRATDLQDISGTAVFLASQLSKGVTGAILDVDSGMAITASPTIPHPALAKRKKTG